MTDLFFRSANAKVVECYVSLRVRILDRIDVKLLCFRNNLGIFRIGIMISRVILSLVPEVFDDLLNRFLGGKLKCKFSFGLGLAWLLEARVCLG